MRKVLIWAAAMAFSACATFLIVGKSSGDLFWALSAETLAIVAAMLFGWAICRTVDGALIIGLVALAAIVAVVPQAGYLLMAWEGDIGFICLSLFLLFVCFGLVAGIGAYVLRGIYGWSGGKVFFAFTAEFALIAIAPAILKILRVF